MIIRGPECQPLWVIAFFSLEYLGWPLFLLIFYAVAMRIFIGNHDRYHADQRIRLPRFFEIISEKFAAVVTPWDEPYDSIRKKHLRHHATHHAWPCIPYNQLDKFDSIVIQNAGLAPEMKPIGY